jgi:hypothetical protein
MGSTGGENNGNLSIFAQPRSNANCYFGDATVCKAFCAETEKRKSFPHAERT